jgi:hypothetical protein
MIAFLQFYNNVTEKLFIPTNCKVPDKNVNIKLAFFPKKKHEKLMKLKRNFYSGDIARDIHVLHYLNYQLFRYFTRWFRKLA